MKQLKFLQFILVIALQSQILAQTPNFTGTWVLNFQKSKLDPTDSLNGLTGQLFIIKQVNEKFSLKIVHLYGDKKSKIGFKMRADGKTRGVKLIFKGKLEPKDKLLVATLWRNNYLNAVTYQFGVNENELVADEVYKGRPKDHHSIWVFDRVVAK